MNCSGFNSSNVTVCPLIVLPKQLIFDDVVHGMAWRPGMGNTHTGIVICSQRWHCSRRRMVLLSDGAAARV